MNHIVSAKLTLLKVLSVILFGASILLEPRNMNATELIEPANLEVAVSQNPIDQTAAKKDSPKIFTPIDTIDEGEVYDMAEKSPKFKGGNIELSKYLYYNLKYPQKAKDLGISGDAIVQFIIDENGKPIQVQVVNQIDELLANEAVRVFSEMPKWKPGVIGGKRVKVLCKLPVKFELEEDPKLPELVMPYKYRYNDTLAIEISQWGSRFYRGDNDLIKFLNSKKDSLLYPTAAITKQIEGTVDVRFLATKEGVVQNIEVIQKANELLDSAALRIVDSIPKWISVYDVNNERDIQNVIRFNFKFVEKDKFIFSQEMPQFPGGERAMMRFIMNTTQYPLMAANQGFQGRVYVSFVVTQTGELKDLKILRSVHPLLDAEAIRVVSLMPKWIPGTRNGDAVDVPYSLPIVFVLN